MTLEPISLNLPGENEYFTQEAYKTLRTNIQFWQSSSVLRVSSIRNMTKKMQ